MNSILSSHQQRPFWGPLSPKTTKSKLVDRFSGFRLHRLLWFQIKHFALYVSRSYAIYLKHYPRPIKIRLMALLLWHRSGHSVIYSFVAPPQTSEERNVQVDQTFAAENWCINSDLLSFLRSKWTTCSCSCSLTKWRAF